MQTYNLRSYDEIMEELRLLGAKKRCVEQRYKTDINDIQSDATVLQLEIDLLKSLGRIA